MSGIEPPGPERRREADIRGRASDNAHVYQAQNNQYIAQFHLHGEVGGTAQELVRAGMRGAALELTQERVTLLIRTLSLTQAELQARCVELEEEARRARAEGRAEALAEMQEQLRAAELRVMKTQQMMRDAVREREKAEALLTRAQAELALRRRAEERREQEQARAEAVARTDAETAAPAATPSEEGEQFTQFLELAEEQLGRVRDDLRLLGEEMSGPDGMPAATQVIEGQLVPHSDDGRRPVAAKPSGGSAQGKSSKAKASPTAVRTRALKPLGPVQRFLVGLVWVLCLVLLCTPMLVVTSIRAAYGSDASLWGMVLFTISAVVLGLATYWFTFLLVAQAINELPWTLDAYVMGALKLSAVGSLVLLVVALFTPLAWPGPAGAWGKGLAAAVGLG
ncbi:hypothetical protein ACWC09_39140 [Streptomyces sp. NPDC001617]